MSKELRDNDEALTVDLEKTIKTFSGFSAEALRVVIANGQQRQQELKAEVTKFDSALRYLRKGRKIGDVISKQSNEQFLSEVFDECAAEIRGVQDLDAKIALQFGISQQDAVRIIEAVITDVVNQTKNITAQIDSDTRRWREMEGKHGIQ